MLCLTLIGLAIALGAQGFVTYCLAYSVGRKTPGEELPNTDTLTKFKKHIWNRYNQEQAATGATGAGESPQNGDRALAYVERIVDRLINKARGVLPFNSIIIAALSFERARSQFYFSFPPFPLAAPWQGGFWETVLHDIVLSDLLLAILLLGYSSFLCLKLFIVHFGGVDNYKLFKNEVFSTIDVINNRSVVIEKSVHVSLWGLFMSVAVIGFAELSAAVFPH